MREVLRAASRHPHHRPNVRAPLDVRAGREGGEWRFRRSKRTPASCRSTASASMKSRQRGDAARFFASFERRVATEAGLIRGLRREPRRRRHPAARVRRSRASRRSLVAIGNFTWDWIYERLPGVRPRRAGGDPRHPPRLCRRRRARCDCRCTAASSRWLPSRATSRSSRDNRRATRRRRGGCSGSTGERPIVLTSFGGYGATLPLDSLRQTGRFTTLDVPREPPAGLLYQDLVAAADVVVSKPGYGIVSECVGERHRAALHVARPVHRIRRLRGGNAADPAVPLPLAGRSARRPLDGCHRRTAGAAGASRTARDRRRDGRPHAK